ncbi:Ppx/GppA family phosphatase [Acidaminobacter sp. JC074]|uniref:Ppx/GppA family phosphatase n=1 Tax=Acidaminobacter sp. JC074 TaxID=2530199 RepID=UPI001F0ECD19|nr:Ppx/GppA family phosphatase [Acidaminobacter sp. JC074]
MRKVACIDIGTNSVRMIVLDPEMSCIEAEKYMETTRIGHGVDGSKILSDEGMDRTVDALRKFKDLALSSGAEKIIAIATSAVRDASNRDVFLERVHELGIHVEMISGQEEARLGFLGVAKGLADSNLVKAEDNVLVIDIGGGSTELIVGNQSGILYSHSLDIGAVRMHDKFVTEDPVPLLEQQDMADFIRQAIKPELDKIAEYDLKMIIGIGGTITTAGSMALEMDIYNRKRIHNYYVPLDTVYQLNRKLLSQTVLERQKHKGLQPKRADIIPCGFMILQLILLALEKDGITISEYDNLEGLFFDKG